MNSFVRRLLAFGVVAPLSLYGAGVALFGAQPGFLGGNPVPCDTDGRCSIDAWVERDGLFGCVVSSEYNKITVGKNDKGKPYQPKIVWVLRPKDSLSYFFDDEGVKLNPDDHNDESKDLYDGGHDNPERTWYRWRDRNGQRKDIRFDLQVRRYLLPGVSTGCSAKDPLISNSGN